MKKEQVYQIVDSNSIFLKRSVDKFIFKNYYIEDNGQECPVDFSIEKFRKIPGNKYVYKYLLYGAKETNRYFYIGRKNWFSHILFLMKNGKTWIQQRENIMWLISIFVGLIAAIGAFLPLF
jgi:hypothetical protein